MKKCIKDSSLKKRIIVSLRILGIILGIITFLLPIIIYVCHFRNYAISTNPTDWGVFGDYIGGLYGGFYSILITVLAIYLARALTKKDRKKEKQSNAAEALFQQIKTIENNNYNLNSISKLRKDINKNEIYLSSELKEDLIHLSDQLNEEKDHTGSVDYELRQSVLLQLKQLYDD